MHRVADGKIRDPEKIAATVSPTRGDPGEEEAAVAAVAAAPAVRNGEEGEREVCGVGLREGSGGDGGGVGRLRGDKAASEDAEERRRVEGVVAVEETVVCNDATTRRKLAQAEARAGSGGESRWRKISPRASSARSAGDWRRRGVGCVGVAMGNLGFWLGTCPAD